MGALLALSLAACGNTQTPAESGSGTGAASTPAETVTLQVGFTTAEDPSDPYYCAASEMARILSEKSGGTMELKLFPNGQLGSETDMLEQMQMNTLGAAGIMCGTMQSLDMRMAIEDLPYMWKDIDHARAAFDGEFGEYLAEIMRGQGMEEIAYHLNIRAKRLQKLLALHAPHIVANNEACLLAQAMVLYGYCKNFRCVKELA